MEAVEKLTMLKHFFNVIYATKELSVLQSVNTGYTLISAKQPGSGESQASVLPGCTDHAGDEGEKETERERTR